MNRRNFLKMLASAAPVAAVAPTYFFAPPGGWRSTVRYEVQQPYVGMYFINKDGIYLNGECITQCVELPVEQLRAMYPMPSFNQRMNEACALMDDFARRCGAEWTDKQWT